ncbi:PREDICTED: transmembrane protein FLJ37396 isoform X1 [Crocodylus porosus]|uniref:transmembrane protein FLJ37396 isoform X1 n=1 Tax=Crocodylus porosus TaxID=8502 RepID=UPI00093EED33|nr:PREDICTED: transmembrane protein FLJ37396 isoform X1 [Crocodylus porosus]
MYNSDDVYKSSSTERVQQLEKELAVQLAELKGEIKDNGVLQGTPNRAYSSVPIPKDSSYFRKEREMILKKGLQVAGAKPLVVQADVMQRELESCLRREYTEENLPLLLHQFFTDRITQLVQSKYLHLLRWQRFCKHSSVIEQLYPLYQKQVGHIMEEYNDAVQRAARLSVARENFLTGKKNPVNVVTQEDLVIYTQWLVCHLHSLKAIHSYLRVLQYLPISHRMDVTIEKHRDVAQDNQDKFGSVAGCESMSSDVCFLLCPSSSYTDGPHKRDTAFMLPCHCTGTDELKPQLQLLLSHFGICYDTDNLKNSADEMELFSLVVRKFRSVFHKQQVMRTFPVYDTGRPGSENWGTFDPSIALKKQANWIPFLQIKPKQDPWQQKLLTKLKQWKKVDLLMDLQSKFLEVSSMEQVMEVLQEHATSVLEPHPVPLNFVTSRSSGQNNYDQIWKRIYSTSELHQEQNLEDDSLAVGKREKNMENVSLSKDPGSSRKKKETGYSYITTLQLLGLEEGTEANNKDVVMRKGAYLSVLYLRHLRIRELKRVCLGVLNYFRSVERSLTISTSGLLVNAGNLVPSAEDTCWVNAVKGGIGMSGGLGSHHYVHYTPADFKVHSAKFMEFLEVENHDDFYTAEDGCIHTQDQRGAYIMYDLALKDLKELENQLLLIASQYIEKEKSHVMCGSQPSDSNLLGWAHASVDRFAVLLDLWTCETTLLENKCQLLDAYFEAYQHALDAEERFALAQAIIDIMYKRPRFDLRLGYFVSTYKDECICLRLHLQLVRDVVNQHIDSQREYVYKIWREGQKGGISEFGLPPNIIAKQLISLNSHFPTLKNIYLLEFHPSLGLVSLIPKALEHLSQEFHTICSPQTASEATSLDKKVLQLALDEWLSLENLELLYSPPIQKDLFSDVLVDDPVLVREIAMSVVESGADEEKKQGKGKQTFILDSFSRLLELVTLRHRLIESTMESARLARFYKVFAREMGFDEFHLHLRPVHFEFASHKEKADQPPPVFITALLEDDSTVDRYIPSSLMLSIQEIDNQIGRFSFQTRDSVIQLLSPSGVQNMQIVLACQVTQKNALIAAVQQASFCHVAQSTYTPDLKGRNVSLRSRSSSASGRNSRSGYGTENQLAVAPAIPYATGRHLDMHRTIKRPPEAFISIQLEKLGPRDLMLNTFIEKKEIMGSRMQNPDEVLKIKREVIGEYCCTLSHRMSHHALRGQIIACYNSLRNLLEAFPVIRDKYFMIGLPQEKKGEKHWKENLLAGSRFFQSRPRYLLSPDGQAFLNLWFIPHSSEVLIMFKMLPEKAAYRALRLSLQIVAALLDIVSYLLSFAQLGNSPSCFDTLNPESLTAAWGGTERIGTELQEIQRMIDNLQNPLDPHKVAQLVILHREVMFLQFDATVRHLLREAFLSSGNISAYQSITDSMYHGLPPLSNSVVRSAFASQFGLPQPLDPHSPSALMLFPWRALLADGGPFPVTISNLIPINYYMQLCLCRLSDDDRKIAHGELVGIHFLMEDILETSCDVIMEDDAEQQTLAKKKQQNLAEIVESNASLSKSSGKTSKALWRQHDPLTSCTLMKSFLIIWKQLSVLKAEWGRLKLKVEDINTVPLYRQFSELYCADILHPAMKTIARQMDIEDEFEELVISSQSILPPKGASEIEIKMCQLQKLLESLEIHMIHDVQRKINQEMTLVTSERAREESGLPTELWKHRVMQENFSVIRPQIVETFVQRLMENSQESDVEISFTKDHLQSCLTALGCDIMARERSNFETYSMFYENILQQQHRLLYQKEQELYAVEEDGKQTEVTLSQIAELSHEMIMEVTALRARVADLEGEKLSLKEKIRKEVQDEYETLVRNLFVTCVQLKGKLDDYRLNMCRQVFEIVNEVRKEGVDSMIELKKKFGSTTDDKGLKEHLSTQEQLQVLQDENNRLGELVCKLKILNCWKHIAQKAQLSLKLRTAEKEALQNKKECLTAKMMAEQEVTLFHEQLVAVRKALARSEAENEKLQKQLDQQKQLLQEAKHRTTHETRSRQQLDVIKAENMQKVLEDMQEKEQRLQCLTEEAEKSAKIEQLQQKRIRKEMRQIRSQLIQERSLKLDAFQRVDELQGQVYDLEAGAYQKSSSGGMRRKATNLLSLSAGSTKRSFSGSAAWTQRMVFSASTHPRDYQQHLLMPDPKGSNVTAGTTPRPKTVPSRWRERGVDTLFPDLPENSHRAILLQLHEQQLAPK